MAPANRSLVSRIKKLTRLAGLLVGAVLLLSAGAALWGVAQTQVERPDGPPIVNDVTALNPVAVAR
ncbi:MAG: hypothetical protein ACREU4_07260, partial [Burkholderiales bacterium]